MAVRTLRAWVVAGTLVGCARTQIAPPVVDTGPDTDVETDTDLPGDTDSDVDTERVIDTSRDDTDGVDTEIVETDTDGVDTEIVETDTEVLETDTEVLETDTEVLETDTDTDIEPATGLGDDSGSDSFVDTDTDTDSIVDSDAFGGPYASVLRRPPMIHVSESSACAVDTDGNVWCWGNRYVGNEMAYDTGILHEPDGPFRSACTLLDYGRALRLDGDMDQWPYPLSGWGWSSRFDHHAHPWVDLSCSDLGVGTCAIDDIGRITCEGTRSGPPPGNAGWSKVSTGVSATCALHRTDGLACWGDAASYGTLPVDHPDARDVAVNGAGVCVVTAARGVACDGTAALQVGLPTQITNAVRVAVGGSYGCVIREQGRLACWGDGTYLGRSAVVEDIPHAAGFVDVSIAANHACAIRADSTVVCWGASAYGVTFPPPPPYLENVVDSDTDLPADTDTDTDLDVDSAEPDDSGFLDTDPPMPLSFVREPPMVSVSATSACALDAQGEAFCWGNHPSDTANVGDTFFGGIRTPLAGSWQSICAGYDDAVALDAQGSAAYWPPYGWHPFWDFVFYTTRPWADLSCGPWGQTMCAIDDRGILYCAGSRAGRVPTNPGWTKVAMGWDAICGLNDAHGLVCWGDAQEFGTIAQDYPDALDVALSSRGACVVTRGHGLACDGAHELTDSVPLGVHNAVAVDVGGVHACALRYSGRVVCWGDGTAAYGSNAVVDDAPTTGGFVSVSVENGQACASRASGTVACWGWNRYGVMDVPAPP